MNHKLLALFLLSLFFNLQIVYCQEPEFEGDQTKKKDQKFKEADFKAIQNVGSPEDLQIQKVKSQGDQTSETQQPEQNQNDGNNLSGSQYQEKNGQRFYVAQQTYRYFPYYQQPKQFQTISLDIEKLTSSEWALSNDNGLIGIVQFSYFHDYIMPGSVTYLKWNFVGPYLEFQNIQGLTSVRFVETVLDYYGKWHLQGRYLLPTTLKYAGWRVYLNQL